MTFLKDRPQSKSPPALASSNGVCFARFARMLLQEADSLALEAARTGDRAAGQLATDLYIRVAQMQADGPPCMPNDEHCGDCPLLQTGEGRDFEASEAHWGDRKANDTPGWTMPRLRQPGRSFA